METPTQAAPSPTLPPAAGGDDQGMGNALARDDEL
jgi:hypothetical protein